MKRLFVFLLLFSCGFKNIEIEFTGKGAVQFAHLAASR